MKILMALAGLEIGGAETHVIELSKELKRRGHDVMIISGGGVYAKEAEDFGIKHFTVPVNKRNYMNIIKSVSAIKKIILTEKPDIVHSHARIPSFIIGEIHRMTKRSFVYVTTVHLDFDTSFIVKKLSRWGEKTLAVSRDLIDYLKENYGISEKNVYTSINGIDSGKFSESVSGDRIVAELGLNPNARRIVYVSRLESDLCLPARCVLERMKDLDEKFPGIELVIVGGGGAFEEIKDMADRVNTALSRRAVILTGKRTDINEIHASADVCLGVSRAILEPMSMAKPCVIAGHQGYIGILTPQKLATAIKTNFTCRGCALTEPAILFEDLCTLLSMEEDKLRETGLYGKSVVREHYSVERMAADNEKMYLDAIRDHKPNTVMVGYYGYGNRGDDALLDAIIEDMRKKSTDFCPVVLSKKPKETERLYGVKSVNRFNFFAISRAMKRAKLLLAGGGSLIQDVTSTRSLMYYLSCLSLGKRLGLKVMLYANGMGPITKEKNRKKSAEILNSADVITVRDHYSAEYLKDMGVTAPEIHVTADPAFSVKSTDVDATASILKKYKIDGKYILFSVRPVSKVEDFEKKCADFADWLCDKYNCKALFVPMQYSKDRRISMDVVSRMSSSAVFADEDLGVEKIIGLTAGAEAVVSVRLHLVLFGAALGVPVVGINYDFKVKSNIESSKLGICFEPDELDTRVCREKTEEFFIQSAASGEETLAKARQFADKAAENAEIAARLLD